MNASWWLSAMNEKSSDDPRKAERAARLHIRTTIQAILRNRKEQQRRPA
jgi:hypothetical protein